MKRYIIMLLAAFVLLSFSGCGWMEGEYVYEETYRSEDTNSQKDAISVSSYMQMRNALVNLIERGAKSGIFDVSGFSGGSVRFFMDASIRYVTNSNAMGAYAVESINYEIGTNTGEDAIALNITYKYDQSHIMNIARVSNMDEAKSAIMNALRTVAPSLVMRISQYEEVNIDAMVSDLAVENPDIVIECPNLDCQIYPQKGSDRIISMQFTYQTETEQLKTMQEAVKPFFSGSVIDRQQSSSMREQYRAVYTYLMNLCVYTANGSSTPAYTLFLEGEGDSAAIASVYAALCRKEGLYCQVISGTKDDQPWCWNIVQIGNEFYYFDPVICDQENLFELMNDEDMSGYIFDFIPPIN